MISWVSYITEQWEPRGHNAMRSSAQTIIQKICKTSKEKFFWNAVSEK